MTDKAKPHFLVTAVLALGMFFCLSSGAIAQTLPRADGGETPIRYYGPQSGCVQTMIVSHGFGGDENGLSGLTRRMADQGWRVLVMGHRESGRQAFREAMFSAAPRQRLTEAVNSAIKHAMRFKDLDAAVTEARRFCKPPRLVLAGHSMGAMTTMLEAGAIARFGRFGENRFDAYIAISPQGIGHTYAAGAWNAVTKPVLMITGTNDNGNDGGMETRLSAFEGLPSGQKRLAIIPGAGHLALASNESNAVAKTVADLSLEFLSGIAPTRTLPPSRIPGLDIRDK